MAKLKKQHSYNERRESREKSQGLQKTIILFSAFEQNTNQNNNSTNVDASKFHFAHSEIMKYIT